MGVQYDGKSPGKLWYFWQKTKALVTTPFNVTTRKDAGRFGKDAGKTAGVLLVGNFALATPVLMAVPILPWIIGGTAFYFAFKYGRDAYLKFGALKETAAVTNFVRRQEDKWYEKKIRKPLLTRIKTAINAKIDAIPRPVMTALKFTGLVVAVAGLGFGGAVALGAYAGVASLAPLAASVVEAGAAIGLTAAAATATAVGVSALALPVAGIGAFAGANASFKRRDPANSPFRFKKPSDGAKPISQGEVFKPGNAKSFDFNDTAPPPKAAANSNSDALEKAKIERQKNRARRDNSKRF
ncbi:MAG TPA: hypothetical protein VEF76_03405 [Patescibacteria group bacterium]|nr:hypothetical protein [Patescibacteria group bacterium]